MKKLDTFCTAVLLIAAMACGIVNFPNTVNGAEITVLNVTATIFFLLFWALILRFGPAAKVSTWLSLYVFASSMIGLCSILGEWENILTKIITTPALTLFYGIKFIKDNRVFFPIMAVISMALLFFSLVTLANRKPAQPKAKKGKDSPQLEAAEQPAAITEKAESITLSETEVVSEAAKYVEMINSFENKEIDFVEEPAEQPAEETETAEPAAITEQTETQP